jgi:hypothetical protein
MTRIRVVVFDLDGTLARTDTIIERRTPYEILRRAQTPEATVALSYGADVSALPGRLVARGYPVAVISRAPMPYASTLLGVLGIDYCALWAGGRRTPAVKLREVALLYDVRDKELLYVGDQPDDEAAACTVGCQFRQPPWREGTSTRLRGVNGYGDGCEGWNQLLEVQEVPDPIPVPGKLDEAVARLRAGTATDTDYELLLDHGYLSILAAYADPDRVPDPSARTVCQSQTPPWTGCTDSDWKELLRTGDINRLLDMQPGRLRLRVPDSALDHVLEREAHNGSWQTVADTIDALAPEITAHIRWPRPPRGFAGSLADALSAPILDGAGLDLLAHNPGLDDDQRAALAYAVLLSHPGQPCRRDLQRLLFTTLPPQARHCVVTYSHDSARFGLSPQLVTRAEYDHDEELRGWLFTALRRLFPLRDSYHRADGAKAYACVPYSSRFGKIWWQAKMWHGTHSGPDVHQSLLEFPALVLAAHLADQPGTRPVVPVPATPCSDYQPGETSLRLGRRAATLADRPLKEYLIKDETISVRPSSSGDGSDVALIDDQITGGGTLAACGRALRLGGFAVDIAFAWSASRLPYQPHLDDDDKCWLEVLNLLPVQVTCPRHR